MSIGIFIKRIYLQLKPEKRIELFIKIFET